MQLKDGLKRSRARDKLFIIAEILEVAKADTLKTQIMYRANLGFATLNDYLGFLLRIELLIRNVNNNKEVFRATEKGIDFLQRYREITELLGYASYKPKHESKIPGLRTELAKLKDVIADLEIGLFNTASCPSCKEEVFPNYNFCPHCGVKLKIEAAAEVTK